MGGGSPVVGGGSPGSRLMRQGGSAEAEPEVIPPAAE